VREEGAAAASMRDGTARGPLAAGALLMALPAPNETPPDRAGTAPGVSAVDATAGLANGPERVCDSLPYQNSVTGRSFMVARACASNPTAS
jgi:hypothetical protein